MDEEIIAAWGEAVAGTLENPQAAASPSSRSIEADLSRGPPFRPSMYINNDWRGAGTRRLAEKPRGQAAFDLRRCTSNTMQCSIDEMSVCLRTCGVFGRWTRRIGELKVAKIEILSNDDSIDFSEIWYDIAGDDHFWIRWRFTVLIDEIGRLGIDTSTSAAGLDIGCGHGTMLRKLSMHTSWRIDGCDLNKTALSLSSDHDGRILLYNIYDKNLELCERYDYLFLLDVIEHVENPQEFVEAALFHVKPGGYVFVNVPALQILYSKYDRAMGHRRRYNRVLLRTQLLAAGLEICVMRYWGITLVPIAIARKFYVNCIRNPTEIARAGMQPPGPLSTCLLSALEIVERAGFKYQPVGTSLLAIARKRR
jgi:2-polyprenyl-3-methyl-5-hydroxy-6-metoxy-1,4-benzoquinol methylase